MGMCEYCGVRNGTYEIVDDKQESGVAMVCLQCHPRNMNKRDKLIQEINELALNDPILLTSIQEHQKGYSTWEEAMMIAVKVLVIQNKVLKEELVRMKRVVVEPMVFGADFGKGESKSVKAVYRKDELGAVISDHIEPDSIKLIEPLGEEE